MNPTTARVAAYFVAHHLRQLRAANTPIPESLTAADQELTEIIIMSANGRNNGELADTEPEWITAEQLSELHECSVRTIRRKAEQYGGTKIAGVWLFPTESSTE